MCSLRLTWTAVKTGFWPYLGLRYAFNSCVILCKAPPLLNFGFLLLLVVIVYMFC